MKTLFPCQTLPLENARLGQLVVFTEGDQTRYGVVYNSTATGSTHQSVLELAPERRRLTDIREGRSVLQLDSAVIELTLNHDIIPSGDIPGDAEHYLGIDGTSIIAGFLHRQKDHKFVDVSSGVLLPDWPSQMTMWFKHWRIVAPTDNGIRILYETQTPTL